MSYRIADGFEQVVTLTSVNRDGKEWVSTLIGTREQITAEITHMVNARLEYGEPGTLTIAVTHPVNVRRLGQQR